MHITAQRVNEVVLAMMLYFIRNKKINELNARVCALATTEGFYNMFWKGQPHFKNTQKSRSNRISLLYRKRAGINMHFYSQLSTLNCQIW